MREEKLIDLASITIKQIFDEGFKYAKEISEINGKSLNVDESTIIAGEYAKCVHHFILSNK